MMGKWLTYFSSHHIVTLHMLLPAIHCYHYVSVLFVVFKLTAPKLYKPTAAEIAKTHAHVQKNLSYLALCPSL